MVTTETAGHRKDSCCRWLRVRPCSPSSFLCRPFGELPSDLQPGGLDQTPAEAQVQNQGPNSRGPGRVGGLRGLAHGEMLVIGVQF